jgi:hypothetical protein
MSNQAERQLYFTFTISSKIKKDEEPQYWNSSPLNLSCQYMVRTPSNQSRAHTCLDQEPAHKRLEHLPGYPALRLHISSETQGGYCVWLMVKVALGSAIYVQVRVSIQVLSIYPSVVALANTFIQWI